MACAHKRFFKVDPSVEDESSPPPLKNQGKKLVVTEFGLAHWLTQNLKLDLFDMPTLKPSHISQTAYDDLKAIIKDQVQVKNKPPVTAEMAIVQNFLKLV